MTEADEALAMDTCRLMAMKHRAALFRVLRMDPDMPSRRARIEAIWLLSRELRNGRRRYSLEDLASFFGSYPSNMWQVIENRARRLGVTSPMFIMSENQTKARVA
jgi:hypothetical protein